MQDDDQQGQGKHDREQRQQGLGGLVGFLGGACLLDPVAGRQPGDDRLQLLQDGRGHIGWLQPLGDVAAHRNGRRSVAPAQDRVFHTHIDGAYLRERNALSCRTDQREAGNLLRVQAYVSRGASKDLHRANVLADFGDRQAVEEKLQLLGDAAGSQADGLQPILLQRKVQGGRAWSPVGIDGSHLWAGIHHPAHVRRNGTQLVRIRPRDAECHREGRVRTEYQLIDAHAGLRRQSGGDRLAQPELQCLAFVLVLSPHHDLCKGGIRQLGRHGEIKPGRALADVGRHDLRLCLPGEPRFHLGRGRAGLGDGSAIRHLDFDQHLGAVGSREELLVHHAHAQHGHHKAANHDGGHDPFALDDAP
ncbi:hypothetical protein D9M72_320080 [compost metagenome]